MATLFDFDGVLVDSEPVHLAAFNDVLDAYGIHIDAPVYAERYLSLDDAGVFRAVLSAGGHPFDEVRIRALVEAKSPLFLRRFDDNFRAFPGAADLVNRRAQRGPVGIVSGALRAEIALALGRLGLMGGISFVVSAESTKASKPDPEPYRAALAELRALGHRDRAVVIEDSTGGVASAKGAGLRCVAVAHTYGAEELRRAGADAVVTDLRALTDSLLEHEA